MQKQIIDRRVTTMCDEISDKMDVLTGFGAEIVKIRSLCNILKFYDKSGTGYVNLEQFHEFMVRLNFVAVNKEVEELFNRFDEEMTGWINYEELAYNLLGHGSAPKLNGSNARTMDNLRSLLLKKGIYAPMIFSVAARTLPIIDGDGNAPLDGTVDRLSGLLGGRIPSQQLRSLLSVFDLHHNDEVNINSFLTAFKSGMSLDRKRLARVIFDKIDDSKRGYITIDEFNRYYVSNFEPRVIEGMEILPRASSDVVAYMTSNQSAENRNQIFWPRFLDFYSCVSLGIDDHDVFEFFLRNSWCIEKPSKKAAIMSISPDSPARMMMNLQVGLGSSSSSLGSPAATPSSRNTKSKGPGLPFRRGMVITHSDGSEEVVEMIDELGKTQIDANSIISLLTSKGVHDVSDIRI